MLSRTVGLGNIAGKACNDILRALLYNQAIQKGFFHFIQLPPEPFVIIDSRSALIVRKSQNYFVWFRPHFAFLGDPFPDDSLTILNAGMIDTGKELLLKSDGTFVILEPENVIEG